jgi:hypothetical protein
MRPALLAAVAVLLVAAAAGATVQDASSYPDGVRSVSNTRIEAGKDFQVTVALDGAADSVAVTVCRFKAEQAPTPDVCYMNLGAKRGADGAWAASTSAVQHPTWRNGWVIGYKVTVDSGEAEAHAPDRTTSTGDQDYYRVVVGSAQEDPQPAPTGSAVVEDAQAPAGEAQPPAAEGGAAAGPRQAGATPAAAALAALALALVALGRHRH